MRSLCKWLDVEFLDLLLESTFSGKLWHGNSADRVSETGFNKNKSIFLWPTQLEEHKKLLTERILNKEMKLLGYKLSTFSRLKIDNILYLKLLNGTVIHYSYLFSQRISAFLKKYGDRKLILGRYPLPGIVLKLICFLYIATLPKVIFNLVNSYLKLCILLYSSSNTLTKYDLKINLNASFL